MTLTQQIDSLRGLVNESYGAEMQGLSRLASEVARRDEALLAEVGKLLAAHEQRRTDLANGIAALGARIGHVPVSVLPSQTAPRELPVLPPAALADPLKIYPQEERAA